MIFSLILLQWFGHYTNLWNGYSMGTPEEKRRRIAGDFHDDVLPKLPWDWSIAKMGNGRLIYLK